MVLVFGFISDNLLAQEYGVLSGMVRDAANGKPLSGAVVVLKDSSLKEPSKGKITNNNGQFEFMNLPQRAYIIDVHLLGYAHNTQRLVIRDSIVLIVTLKQEAVKLAGIKVDGQRTTNTGSATQQTTLISAAELDRERGQTLGDALKTVTGVTLLQTGPSIAKPVIRGLHSQRVLVLNAGVAQEGQQWGAEHAPEIDPFAPAQIEVLKGAAGVEYGMGAIGGVVRLLPRELPATNIIRGEVSLNGFTNNRQGASSAFVEGGTPFDGLGWRLQGSLRQAGDTKTAEYVMGNTGFREANGSLNVGYKRRDYGIEAYYSHFSTELGIFRGSHIGTLNDLLRAIEYGRPFVDYTFSYDINPPKQEITHDLWSVSGFYAMGIGRLEMQYGWQQNNRSEYDAHNFRVRDSVNLLSALARPALGLELTTNSLDLKLRHTPITIGEGTLSGTAGMSGTRQSNARTGRVYLIPGFRAYSGGIYALENYAVGDWLFNAGVRFDTRYVQIYGIEARNLPDTTQIFSSVTGALGVLWYFNGNRDGKDSASTNGCWSLAMNLTSAWRPPQVNEQFSNDVHHGTAQFEIGDPNLRRERSYAADMTLHYNEASIHAEFSVYCNLINDFIFLLPDVQNPTVTVRGTFPTFRYRQAKALLRGVETQIRWQMFDEFSLGGNLSLVRGDNLNTNEPLFQMPADRLRLNARWDAPFTGTLHSVYVELISTLVRRQDRAPANVDYAPPPAGYGLLDITFGGAWKLWEQPVRWNISVQNMLNNAYRDYLSRYRYFTDDAGRNIVIRISIPFGMDPLKAESNGHQQ